MAQSKKPPRPSFHAFVEQTAQFLRAASKPKKVKRSILKSDALSHTNKIHQIARILRCEAKKGKKRKNIKN
jgi:hypothetical protein